MKHCSNCKATKPLAEFYNNRTVKDGKARECKACANDMKYAFRAKLKGKQIKKTVRQVDHSKLKPVCPWPATTEL